MVKLDKFIKVQSPHMVYEALNHISYNALNANVLEDYISIGVCLY